MKEKVYCECRDCVNSYRDADNNVLCKRCLQGNRFFTDKGFCDRFEEKKVETYPNCDKCRYWYCDADRGHGCGAPFAIRECWAAMDAERAERTGYLVDTIRKINRDK